MPRFSTEMARRVRGALPALVGVAVSAAAMGAYAASSSNGRKPPFMMTARPGRLTVSPGAAARYLITVHRHHFGGRVRLHVSGVPRHAIARISFVRHSRRRAVLAVFTSPRTPQRRFGLRVRATHGRLQRSLRLTLIVDPPQPASVAISGHALAPLWPGVPEPIDIALANPNRSLAQVTGLEVALTGLTAPRATATRPCSLADFTVQQFRGSYPIVVPARSTRSLAVAGIAPALWPQVEIVNRSVNQDGCQDATIALSYRAAASTR
jgi:hypothetical protein